MNFSTPISSESTSVEQIESLRDWWNLAGVDLHYTDEPTSLLTEAAVVEAPVEPKPVETIAPTESKAKTVRKTVEVHAPSENYPDQHDAFLSWLSSPANLVEAHWSQNHILPTGVIEPEIMIIAGMPEQGGLTQNSLFAEKSAALLSNMLKAIGCDSEQIYVASVSLTRSFDGRIDPKFHETLKKRIFHHIELVQPKRIILFGDTPSQMFFDQNLLSARKNKQFVNHGSFKTEAIATFHPRILIERPEFKAEAWKDLQLLTRITSS